MTLTHLSTKALLDGLAGLLGSERQTLARLIAHLVEVEDRRLHLELACSSLFDFCTRKLGLSEGEAYRRINAARLVRRFPIILELVAAGRIHLSALALLRDHLTETNHRALLDDAAGKTKNELKELLAARFPRPDVPTTIRKLPSIPSSSGAARADAPALPLLASPSSGSTSAAPVEPSRPQNASGTQLAANGPSPARMEPLAPARYKMQLTAHEKLKEKLDRAARLMGQRSAEADLATVMERALDSLIAELEKARFGKTSRPQRRRKTKRGYVARATRREVVARDGEQCSFVGDDGQRCPARTMLEFDHRHARAKGGSGEADNVRMLCRAHNLHAAERAFGRSYIAMRIRMRQQARNEPSCESPPPRL